MLKKIITEPLLHFIVISILFFAVYNALNPAKTDQQTIIVSEGRVAQIKNSFIKQWKRAPLAKELGNAIQAFAINEMYVQEARASNLDIGDQVINRRLQQKMTFILEGFASSKEPSDIELKQLYNDNLDKYRLPPQYSFTQIFISADRNEEELQALITRQQQRIKQGLKPEGEGSMLPNQVSLETSVQLARKFGDKFSSALENIELNQWSAPIKSAFGWHFVFLKEKKPANINPFETVKKSVLSDWQYQNTQRYQEQYEQRLLERYQIEVEKPSAIEAER